MKRLLTALAMLVLLVAAAPAQAARDLSWHGYQWHTFDGQGRLGQTWRSKNIAAGRRIMHLRVTRHAGGGVAMLGHSLGDHGHVSVRFRMTRGTGSRYVLLLWPDTGLRPEVDFAEGDDSYPGRRRMTGTYHWGLGPHTARWFFRPGRYTHWHTASVRWGEMGTTWLVDGDAWAHVSEHPTGGMHLVMQSVRVAAGTGSVLEIRSVKISG